MALYIKTTLISLCLLSSSLALPQGSSKAGGQTCKVSPLRSVESYTLIDSLLHGRSRRFFKGATMPGEPLNMSSKKEPERLSLEEEALLAFAGAGITGYIAADLPFQPATTINAHSGNGNVLVQLAGRTFASGDSAQLTTLFVINDDGIWMIRKPQDLSPEELELVIQLGRQKKWVEAYKLLRVEIRRFTKAFPRKKFEIPRIPQMTATFNMWSVNQAGTTYFLPMIDYSSIYLAVMFHLLSPEVGVYMVDERNRFNPAGVESFVHLPGLQPDGWLNSDPNAFMTNSIGNVEVMVAQFAAVELGGMLQNLRLMSQALGLGGFPNYAGTPGLWGSILGFKQEKVKFSKLMGLPGLPFDYSLPVDLLIEKNGKAYLKAFTPPNYSGSGYETAKAYAEMKFGKDGSIKGEQTKSAWKNEAEVKSKIPTYSEKLIKAVGNHIDYVFSRYGRFPAINGPIGHLTAYQAHVLDTDFYSKYYNEGILSNTHQCRSK